MATQPMDVNRLVESQGVFCLILAGDGVDAGALARSEELLGGLEAGFSRRVLHPGRSVKLTVTHEPGIERGDLFNKLKLDARDRGLSCAIYPDLAAPPEFRVALMDMDSTLINQEVIEELAEFAGVREHVTRVTTLAMEGKLDFHQALRERVKLLAGQPATILQEVYTSRISATPGLAELIAGFTARGITAAVVSGGFLPIVEPFAAKVGLAHAWANTLEIRDGKLTGEVTGEIVDANVKRRVLGELAERYRCDLRQTIAIGDGANDLKMINASGLGVAFCAKPIVQEQALAAVNRRRLDEVLLFLE